MGHLSRFNINISRSTLLRKLKFYGLSRRRGPISNDVYINVRRRIGEILDGPGSCGGYRTVWHTLRKEGFQVPRQIVQNILKDLDPLGIEARKAHKLRRRLYKNPGPNYAWHIDGYDKLKPWGFPIHGCIDGFSRKVMWLHVSRSNKSPDRIASMFLNAVQQTHGAPKELVTDLGTENGIAAAAQAFFNDNADSHRYVPSTRNQRIESWWSYFSKTRTSWWRNFFKDLEFQGIIDLTCDLNRQLLYYCFNTVIQSELDDIVEHWNTHYIRKSRHDCIAGRPDSIFYLPERFGGLDQKVQVDDRDIAYIRDNIVHEEEGNEYTEYFDYVMSKTNIVIPKNWMEALTTFERILVISKNGE